MPPSLQQLYTQIGNGGFGPGAGFDDEVVFVTSANLTEAALDRNIELGLLVRDRALAVSVSSHFRVLIDRGLLRPLPMA